MNENNLNNGQTTPTNVAPQPVEPVVNKPMQTIDHDEKIAPNSVINTGNINTNANSPTNIDDVQISTVTIDASSEITAREYVEKEKYKLTGTAEEHDLKLEEEAKKDEILDEVQIKRDLQKENEKFKKDIIYILTFIGVIFLGIAFMPYIIKIVGIG